MNVFLALCPIIVIFVMLLVFKKSADVAGTWGWLATAVLAYFVFDTSLQVVARSTVAGLIASFPVSMVVASSLLLMAFMEKTGALKRIIIFIKTIASENKAVQIMLINIGFGTLMVSVGATPVSVLPPILLAMGYSTYMSIALPAIGYDSLCTYALLGAPIVVFASIFKMENDLSQIGRVFAVFLPVVSTAIGFCMLWIVGKWEGIKKGWLPCIITGAVIGIIGHYTNMQNNLVVLTGIFCGIGVIIVMALYLKVTGKKIIDNSILTADELKFAKQYPLWKAFSPWAILIFLIVCVNVYKPSFEFLYKTMLLPIMGISADGKGINTRALWNAYTWIFISVLLSIPFLRPTKAQIKDTLSTFWKRAPRPVYSAAIFFAIGEVMNKSGYHIGSTFKGSPLNMISVLANSSANAFGHAYGVIIGFIGLFGGFITGSEASTIGMFAAYARETATKLNFGDTGVIIIVAGLAFGGGLASVISPAKLQNAAAAIDKMGEENKVIPAALVFAVILTVISTVLTVLFLKYR
ncbi:MAG: L-lactate permease [Hyphomonadaceae bacterium]|nr:L-lactate permease [Clostridia bacterium]